MPIIHTDTPNAKFTAVRDAYPTWALGCDASMWQGDINFEILGSRGVLFGAFRTSVGDYYADPMRQTYYLNAKAQGIHQTDYHGVRPDIGARAQMDKYYASRPTRDTPPVWGPVLDDEIHGKEIKVKIRGRKYKFVWKKFSRAQITDRLLECKEIIEQRDGQTPIHYSYLYFFIDHLEDTPELWEMDQWLAHYHTLTPGWIGGRNLFGALNGGKATFRIWQCLADADDQGPYFGSGAHGFDVDLYLGTDEEFIAEFITKEPPPPPPDEITFPLSTEGLGETPIKENREAINKIAESIEWR